MTDLGRLVDACMLPGFAGGVAPDWVLRALEDGLAGVALYGPNVTDGDAVRRLSAQVHSARGDALVALDEEGGDVTRLDYLTGSRYPGNLALGVVDDLDATYAIAAAIAQDLAIAGVDVNLAPVLDVNSDAENPVIGVRSFGSDPELVARHGAAFVQGLQENGVLAVAKHFPGHGATRTDSHHSLPVISADERTIRRRDLPPFVAAIEAGVRGVMTGHLLLPALDNVPATLSTRILTGLLREELGFDGVIVTDALDMAGVRQAHGIAGAAVLSLIAGADLLLLGAEDGQRHRADVRAAVERAMREGDLPLARLEDAARRVRSIAADRTSIAPSHPPAAKGFDEAVAPPLCPPSVSGLADSVARRAVSVIGTLRPVREAVVVELRSSTNLAVGHARWSLADPFRKLGALINDIQVTPSGPSVAECVASAGGAPIVVAVRDAYRSDWQRTWVRELLDRRPDAILVGLGLPQDADLAGGTAVLAHSAARVSTAAAAHRVVERAPGSPRENENDEGR